MFSRRAVINAVIRAPIVLLTGGPGSGKGVLAQRVLTCEHISLGEVLRERLANPSNSQMANLKEQMQRGELLPDKEVMSILFQQPEFYREKPVLLDGFPRTMHQWELLGKQQVKPVAAIDISVQPETMRQRLLNRGREDDLEYVIDHRIEEYLTKTKPMSDAIHRQVPNSLVIPANTLTPDEIAEIAKDFLDSHVIYQNNSPALPQRIS